MDPTQERELVFSVENRSPVKDAFHFQRLAHALNAAGRYVLQYAVSPPVPGAPGPLSLDIAILVSPGAPARLRLGGEGAAVAALRPVAFGGSCLGWDGGWRLLRLGAGRWNDRARCC